MIGRAKRVALGTLTAGPLPRLFWPLTAGRVTIFMLHRFADERLGTSGHSIGEVRDSLVHLRRSGYEILSLRDAFRRLSGDGPPPRRAVAFTMDDGYRDQAEAAALFADLGCPVTIFLSTGFVDGRLWFWWDRLQYAFDRTRRERLEILVAGRPFDRAWSTPAERTAVMAELTERCKEVDDDARLVVVADTALALEVELPDAAPEEYAPMTWELARRLEPEGVSFGPHTVTHPILSRMRDRESADEIEGSWSRLSDELREPLPVFCYPNGRPVDFGDREVDCLRQLGFAGAVMGQEDYAEATSLRDGERARFRVKRFSYPEDRSRMIQYTSGIERLKQLLRTGS